MSDVIVVGHGSEFEDIYTLGEPLDGVQGQDDEYHGGCRYVPLFLQVLCYENLKIELPHGEKVNRDGVFAECNEQETSSPEKRVCRQWP